MTVLLGDCREVLKTLPDNSVDSIVTDPPYELGFMGKSWDATGIAYNVTVWAECLRVLKPGGHLLAFGGSRTYHRLACAVEDAGFQIRDQIMWVYGSGFPKSLNIGKAIDKQAGVEREIVSTYETHDIRNAGLMDRKGSMTVAVTAPATDEAKQWDGWGTALKPAHEPIVLARKPLDGTVANNVLKHGVGGLNIDGCRVGYISEHDKNVAHNNALGMERLSQEYGSNLGSFEGGWKKHHPTLPGGRFPANFIHDGSDEVLELFPRAKGMSTQNSSPNLNVYGGNALFPSKTTFPEKRQGFNDDGSAARFFYCAKANKKDRNEGLDGSFNAKKSDQRDAVGAGIWEKMNAPHKNHHPTVKPTDLMRYLCRLITPPNGTVLDPFTGSGSTGKAAILEGFKFVGIEQSAEYVEIATARIEYARQAL